MPLQNRVDPFGRIVATPERGSLLGNRGLLHDASQQIVRPWRLKRWIACVLSFRGRRRTVMTPGRYTELFFLDEATALAAGHRPCMECRRADLLRFKAAWHRGNPSALPPDAPLPMLDDRLHAERIDATGRQRTFRAAPAELPAGTMVAVNGAAHLWLGDRLLRWSFAGYTAAELPQGTVEVLTPRSIVRALAAGYRPPLPPSASA